jgi:uncharacterized protein (TIGR03083 family)
MSRTRTETVEGLGSEWATSEGFIRGLSDADMERGSRCEGWTVRHLAEHIVENVSDLAGGTVGNTPGRHNFDEGSSRTSAQLADELHASAEIAMKLLRALDDHFWAQPSPFPGLTVRQGVEVLWVESFVHEDDIRHALGLGPRPAPGLALEITLRHIAEEMGRRGWNRRTLEFEGLPKIHIGPGGERIGGDPMRFVLAATGRIDASEVGLDDKVNIYRL